MPHLDTTPTWGSNMQGNGRGMTWIIFRGGHCLTPSCSLGWAHQNRSWMLVHYICDMYVVVQIKTANFFASLVLCAIRYVSKLFRVWYVGDTYMQISDGLGIFVIQLCKSLLLIIVVKCCNLVGWRRVFKCDISLHGFDISLQDSDTVYPYNPGNDGTVPMI